MKAVKAFFVMLYIQLALQYCIIPIVLFGLDEDGEFRVWTYFYFIVTLLSFVAVQIVGCVCAVSAVKMHMKSESEALEKSWILLKIKTIPFYVLNFIYGLAYAVTLIGASRGMVVLFIFPLLIPIWYTCAFIVQSGFFGAANVAMLRKKYGDNISLIHYVFQFIPVLDVLSTIILKSKCRKLQTSE